jgi:hypothetical protein
MVWPFSSKGPNSKEYIGSPEYIANQQARNNLSRTYGRRGTQSKFADINALAKGEEFSYHNDFDIDKNALAKEFLRQTQNTVKNITPEQKQGLLNWGNELKKRLSDPVKKITDTIIIPIPIYIARLLMFMIGFCLAVFAVGAVFTDIALAVSGSAAGTGMAKIIMNGAFQLMGLNHRITYNSNKEGGKLTRNTTRRNRKSC